MKLRPPRPLPTGIVAVVLTAALLTASPLAGQQASGRDGLWLSAGAGTGFDQSMRWGRVGYLRLGTTLGPHLLVGVQGILFDAAVGGEGWKTRSNLTASVLAYPSETGGFFFKAGVGYASDEYRRVSDIDAWITESLPGVNLGLGHDLRLGDGNLYLTPNVDLLLGMFEDGFDNPDASLVFTLGLGFR